MIAPLWIFVAREGDEQEGKFAGQGFVGAQLGKLVRLEDRLVVGERPEKVFLCIFCW
jgi:hypothetical protein